ncbi:MAG: acyltransferase, partial [Thermoanaerobaculia bacterium]
LAQGTTIRIGEGCLIAQFCTIVAANHDLSRRSRMIDAPCSTEKTGVTIGDDVWIGAGAIILPGVAIASGAVIAAGSVVTHAVGPFEIWAGNPARQISSRPE